MSYDGSVRNSEGSVIQFVYGDDGLDPSHIEREDFPFDLDRLHKYVRSFYPKRKHEYALNTETILLVCEEKLEEYRRDTDLHLVERYYKFITEFFVNYTKKVQDLEFSLDKENAYNMNYSYNYGLTRR